VRLVIKGTWVPTKRRSDNRRWQLGSSEEAFRILGADDVKNLFGVDTAWDVVEEVLVRYFNERLVTSPRQRMAENRSSIEGCEKSCESFGTFVGN
jgi:hypothetical protein